MLNIPVSCLERWLFPPELRGKNKLADRAARPLSLFLILLFLAGILAMILLLLIPQLKTTFLGLGENLQHFIPRLERKLREMYPQLPEWLGVDPERLQISVSRFWKERSMQMMGAAIIILRRVCHGLGVAFVAFAFACYLLLQKEVLGRQAKKVLFAFVPTGKAEAALEVLTLTGQTFTGFFTGQCLEALILGGMFVASMWILRFPCALLVGMIISITALVPIFGAFAGCALGFCLIFLSDPVKAASFVLLFLILQQIEGSLIYPRVVGNSVGLPPIWVLASVSIGGSIMGIAGMLLFIPLASVSYALFREIVYLLLRKRKISPEKL